MATRGPLLNKRWHIPTIEITGPGPSRKHVSNASRYAMRIKGDTLADSRNRSSINVVCPYYTMYPLDFPLRVLRQAHAQDWVLDPFCGRGTTQYAARLLRLGSVGIDSSPVAVAVAKSKLPYVTTSRVLRSACEILEASGEPSQVPMGEFWRMAFHPDVLLAICKLREALLDDCRSDARIVLRAIVLGALHGPLTNGDPSYLSNQSPRTFSPKPRYALKFWTEHKLEPPEVDVLRVIQKRVNRYLEYQPTRGRGFSFLADSRIKKTFELEPEFAWIVTSPPYYGMRTYLPDQWIRAWFLGASPEIVYRHPRQQIDHGSPDDFVAQLSDVWKNAASVCTANAHLVCRFGGIRDRTAEPLDIILSSIRRSPWQVATVRCAGTSLDGKRQSLQFSSSASQPLTEYDVYARLV